MAKAKSDGGKVQIVFLVDVFSKRHFVKQEDLEEVSELRCRAISLCVLRLLLHFNAPVEHSTRTKPLTWGFKFFNSRILSIEYKRRKFYNLDSDSFRRFEKEMEERFASVCSQNETESKQTCSGAKALSCSFTEILHDFSWTTPDISSPFRNGKGAHLKDGLKRPKNFLFVLGDCPLGNSDLQFYFGRKEVFNEDVLMKEVFSPALYEEFRSTCDLSLFWIDVGLWCLAPEKLDVIIKDWNGYRLMTAITKHLGGNMIPITLLVQDLGTVLDHSSVTVGTHKDPEPDASTKKSCGGDAVANSDEFGLDNKVMQATFHFSFGQTVQAFLSGKDLTGLEILNAASSFPKGNSLLRGYLYFEANKKVCHLKLTPITISENSAAVNQSQSCPGEKEHTSMTNNKEALQTCNLKISKNHLSNSWKSSLVTAPMLSTVEDAASHHRSSSTIQFCLKTDQKIETEPSETEHENAFFIKGVICHGSVPPSWLHPTKLYSCLSYGNPSTAGSSDSETSVLPCSSGLLQQVVLLISSKGLNMVVELRDPESCAQVTGLLQPVTSACAVLSIVKTEMLLMIEKLLLRQRTRGPTLVSRDVSVNEATSPVTLPVELFENATLSSSGLHKASVPLHSGSSCKHPKGSIVDSFIRDIDRKRQKTTKDGKDLLVKLRDYYLDKQARRPHVPSKETTVHRPLTRGRLCQDTSQKNKASADKENEPDSESLQSKCVGEEEPEIEANRSGLDSVQQDLMEHGQDGPDMIDIRTVDDLKAYLEKGYQKCLDLNQPIELFASHAFSMIDHLKSDGELKDLDHILDVLKSSVLRDNESLRKMFEERGDTANKEKIALEYKLQVFLRLELANKIGGVDEENLASEITVMLRAISFQKDPTYLSSFLKNNIITRYAGSLSRLLCHVYDGLMQRPPKEILSPSQISSEEDTPLKSCKVPSVSGKCESVEETRNSRTVVRRNSVMDVAAKRREIVVPVKAKSAKHEKEGRRTGSAGKGNTSIASRAKTPATPVKKVRRNLFMRGGEGETRRTSPRKQARTNVERSQKDKLTRRHSIAGISRLTKVVDTPVCKQVSTRMLHRQAWARRRAKTVTDVTTVGDTPLKEQDQVRPFPRKSPRKRAATFYSAAAMTSVTAKSSIRSKSDTVTTISDGRAKDMLNKVVEGKSNERLTRYSSMNQKFAIDGKPNSRRRLRRSLSLKETSSSVGVDSRFDDPFVEVFMDRGETNQTTRPSGSSLGPSTIPFKSPLIQSTKTLSHRSKSSPSLSKSSPVTSKLSSSLPKGSLNSPKSLVSTSPTLFKSPPIDPKLSPASSHSTKTLDISIPLTPVKSAHLKLVESYTKRTDPSCTDCSTAVKQHRDSTSSPNTRKSPGKCSPSPRTKLRNIAPRARFDDLKSPNQRNGNEDLKNVVGTTPRLIRKRSLMYSAEPIACKKDVKSKNFVGSEVSQKSSFTESRTPAVSVKEKNGECSVTSDSVAQQYELEVTEQKADSNSSGFREQSEVFTSPVGKKRKRSSPGSEHTSGSVSPLNQILKQRKNLRKTPPGTSSEDASKPERELSGVKKRCANSEDTEDSSSYRKSNSPRNPPKVKRPSLKEKAEKDERSEIYQANEPTDYLWSTSGDARSPDKINSPRSSRKNLYRNSLNVFQLHSLQPYFTPISLSDSSLKHLEESPVLHPSGSQTSDHKGQPSTSLSRKWSERRSPLEKSRLTLRKRSRQDSH